MNHRQDRRLNWDLLAHVTTIDRSLVQMLGGELEWHARNGGRVVGVSAPGPMRAELEARGIQFVGIPSLTRSIGARRDLRAIWELWSCFRTLRPAVVHTHTPKAGVLARIAARAARVPVVVNTCHGLPYNDWDTTLERLAVIAIERVAAVASDLELFQNMEDEQTMKRLALRRRTRYVGNGIVQADFQYSAEGRARIRDELRVGADEILIGAVGRQVREKGAVEFVEVARRLADQACFIWLGKEEPLKRDAIEIGGPVRCLGYRRDMRDVYSALDIFVLPSHREGFPRSAMEAASIGCPLVLTDIRGAREVGAPDKEVVFVTPRSVDSLEQALVRLIADPGLRSDLSANARARARAFDQNAVAASSGEAYRSVMQRKARRLVRKFGTIEGPWAPLG